MPTYEYQRDNVFYLGGRDETLTKGDKVEFEDGPPEAFDEDFVEVVDDEKSNEVEEVEAPFDPTELTVEQLEAELEAGDFSSAELELLEEFERAGDEEDVRTTALDAINDAKVEE